MLTTTYNVGELSALCGVMGAKAEKLPVFHLVGAPSTRLARTRRPMHHSFGDGDLDQFRGISEKSACVSACLTPENAIAEMERVIKVALSNRQPGYIQIPQDSALMPVVGEPIRGMPLAKAETFSSNPRELDAAVKAIVARLTKAKSPVAIPAYTIARFGLQKELEAFLAATGIPFAGSAMGKGMISESNPLYLGMYVGDFSTGDVRKVVEGADLVLNLGGELFPDLGAGGYSCRIEASKMLTIWPDHVEMNEVAEPGGRGQATFAPVHMKDLLQALTKAAPKFKAPAFARPTGIPHRERRAIK